MPTKILNVLQSTRFWAVVLGSVLVYLFQEGIISEQIMQLANTILAGYVVKRSLDSTQ
jgi:hypothetical protein